MFTPAGAKSRAARVNKRTRLETTNDHAAIPNRQTRTTVLDDIDLANDTSSSYFPSTGSIAMAFNAFWPSRHNSSGSPEHSIVENLESKHERTPSRVGPSLDQIEASLNRRGSLRSASKSIKGSSSSVSQQDSNIMQHENQNISLDYDVTQSSVDRSTIEDLALIVQLDAPTRGREIIDSQNSVKKHEGEETSKRQATTSRIFQAFWFWLYFVRRLYQVTLGCVSRYIGTSSKFWHGLTEATRRGRSLFPWLISFLAIALPFLYIAVAQMYPSQISRDMYVAPSISASDTHEIASRLYEVERTLETQARFTQKLKENAELTQNDLYRINAQGRTAAEQLAHSLTSIRQMEGCVNDLSNNVETLQKSHIQNVDGVTLLGSKLDALQEVIESKDSAMRQLLYAGLEHSDRELKSLNTTLEQQRSNLSEVFTRRSSQPALTKDALHARILDMIEQSLPESLVVSLQSGRAQSTAEFWRFLSEFLMFKGHSGFGTSVNNTDGTAENSTFIAARYRASIDGEHAKQWLLADEHGAIISRKHFMKLLNDELSPIVDDLQTRLALLEQPPVKDGIQSGSTEKHTGQSTTIHNNKNPPARIVQQLVSTAIHKYSLDVLARPDYASYIAGARINPFLTSATYLHQPAALMPRMISKFLSIGSTWSHPPAVAIHASNAVGMCWAFPGDEGQLGVKLAKPVYLTDIALEHVHPDIAHDATTAPREVEIWIHPIGNPEALNEFTADPPEGDRHARRSPPAAGFIFAMQVIYNVYNKEQAVQLFPIPQVLRQKGLLVNQVVYRIKSNWGNEDFTCLYRVRAIGTSITSNEAIEQDEDL